MAFLRLRQEPHADLPDGRLLQLRVDVVQLPPAWLDRPDWWWRRVAAAANSRGDRGHSCGGRAMFATWATAATAFVAVKTRAISAVETWKTAVVHSQVDRDEDSSIPHTRPTA